ncbi:MAG TPA: 50S ribosomal protein L35 [Patescibacteria group bacterium]|nr:50S ribosomal protein L35 [Patescibacteria group bacterium]
MKLKTHQATAKKIKVTKGKKYFMKTSGQDHFNARESGKTTRNKRRFAQVAKTDLKNVRRALPYS